MLVQNNTHYLSVHSLYYNEFPSPNTFCAESSRRQSYMQRLYFEFLDVMRLCGLVFFYTLTYNDASIPTFYGKPCFSYEHIRYVVNGKLSKWLKRNHNCLLRYFVVCETGEGKGKRGLGYNPHYHFIFFVRPLDGDLHGLTPSVFKSYIEEVWQGHPGRCDWTKAKFGHCQSGDNLGVVTSSSAFSYVCKYVTKDSSQLGYESYLKDVFLKEVKQLGFNGFFLYSYYKYLQNTKNDFSRSSFLHAFRILAYVRWRRYYNKYRFGLDTSYEAFLQHHCGYTGKKIYSVLSKWYFEVYLHSAVNAMYSEYRNKYSSKVRCSKHLGEYGLQFLVEQPNGVFLRIDSPKGYRVQSAALYYIRKKYYNIKLCPYTGSPLYYLNDDGLRYKCSRLKSDIDSMRSLVCECLSLLPSLNNDELYSRVSSVFTHDIDEDIEYRYACYRLVYRYRRYQYFDNIKLDAACDFEDVFHDYKVFLSESSFNLDFEDCTIHEYLLRQSEDLLSFEHHDAFRDYIKFFKPLDDMLDYVSSYRDTERKNIFSQCRDFLKRHKAFKFSRV